MKTIDYKKIGKQGGKATFKKYGKAHFVKLAKRMHRKRKKDLLQEE